MSSNKILAIVVTYNRLALLKQCLEALLSIQEPPFDILIVDNASSDDTKEYLSSLTNVQTLTLETNLGGAGGFHMGFKYAYEHGYDYLWAMDDDTLPNNDSLRELCKAALEDNEEHSFYASLVYASDGKLAQMNNCLLVEGGISTQKKDIESKDSYPILTATFVSFFMKVSYLKEYGLPIKEMFLWSDDTEFTSRMCKRAPGLLITKSKVLHQVKENVGTDLRFISLERLDRMRMNIRNRYYIARRDGVKKKCRFYARHFVLFWKVLFQAKDHRFKRVGIIFKGIKDGYRFRPMVEYPNGAIR